MFSKLEETRATLETHLGLGTFLEAYHLIQVVNGRRLVERERERERERGRGRKKYSLHLFCPGRGTASLNIAILLFLKWLVCRCPVGEYAMV